MGRQRAEEIKISAELVKRSEEGAVLTQEILEQYVEQLRAQGRREDSVRSSEKTLRQFCAFLPEDAVVTKDTLQKWREQLLSENYAIRTVNSKVSTVNALLESMDCRDLQATRQLKPEQYLAPELTRQEYVRMLQTAKGLGDQRSYLLTKLFATTGIAVMDLPRVTVESAKIGSVQIPSGPRMQRLCFPACLQEDLLQYAARKGRSCGMIFTKRNGDPLERTQVSLYIQRLAVDARVPVEKGNIRCLRQLYKKTISGIEANFDLLVRQAYEQQLAMEQLSVGWEETS